MAFDFPADLRFKCAKCGICCGDTPERIRHILLLNEEAEEIALATLKPITEFAERIQGKEPYSFEMKKTLEKGKCVFLSRNNCTIYASRPLVCRFYPFELETAANQEHKFEYTQECPSIGKGPTLGKTYFEKLFQMARTKMEKS